MSSKIYSTLFCVYMLCPHSLCMKIQHFCHGKNVWNALCFIKKFSLQFINLFFFLESKCLLCYMVQEFIIQRKAESPWRGMFQFSAVKERLLNEGKKINERTKVTWMQEQSKTRVVNGQEQSNGQKTERLLTYYLHLILPQMEVYYKYSTNGTSQKNLKKIINKVFFKDCSLERHHS